MLNWVCNLHKLVKNSAHTSFYSTADCKTSNSIVVPVTVDFSLASPEDK